MTASIDVGVFAGRSPRTRLAIWDALEGGLRAVQEQWPGLEVARYDYVAPPYLLGHTLLLGQVVDHSRGRAVEASGCSIEVEAAIGSFVGELVERAAASWFCGNEAFRIASELELRSGGQAVFECPAHLGTALDPGSWNFRPYDPAARYRWLRGEDLATGRPVWVPAALVAPAVARSDNLCEITSVGTAAAASTETATERAVAELYERDALRTAWFFHGRFAPGDVPRSWVEAGSTDARLGWSTRFCRLPATGGGAGAVVFTRHRRAGLYAIGSSCSPRAEQAVSHAWAEAMQGRLLAWLHRSSTSAEPVRTYLDHVLYRGGPDRLDDIEALFGLGPVGVSGSETASDSAPPGAVRVCLLDTKLWKVVKVLAPTLQPLEAAHTAARLVGRARRLARRCGARTEPHPFA